MTTVHRLVAHARLDDAQTALGRARAEAAEGDESWEQWVAEYERGDAVVISLELTLEVGNGAEDVIRGRSEGLFVELDADIPQVERQIAELASGDVTALADELAARGQHVDADELGEMYVHVEIDPELRAALARHGRGRLAGGA